MDVKKKFINLNSVKQTRSQDRNEPFSNYVQISSKKLQESLLSDYNFRLAHTHVSPSRVPYGNAYFDHINKMNSRKIQFDLDGNKQLKPTCNDKSAHRTSMSNANTNININSNSNINVNLKGILKASHNGCGRTFRDIYGTHYFSNENFDPSIIKIKKAGHHNEMSGGKKSRLSEIKSKIRNSGRFFLETKTNQDPFSNFLKFNLGKNCEKSSKLLKKVHQELNAPAAHKDPFSNYLIFNGQKNPPSLRADSSTRHTSNRSNQVADPFSNYCHFGEQKPELRISDSDAVGRQKANFKNVTDTRKESPTKSYNYTQNDLFSKYLNEQKASASIQSETSNRHKLPLQADPFSNYIVLNNHKDSSKILHDKTVVQNFKSASTKNELTPNASSKSAQVQTHSSNIETAASISKNKHLQGTLTCKIFLRNPQTLSQMNASNKTKVESHENRCPLKHSNCCLNNRANFISKSCLINNETNRMTVDNNGRKSAFERDMVSAKKNERSSSLPQKYQLTDVKKAIIICKTPTISSQEFSNNTRVADVTWDNKQRHRDTSVSSSTRRESETRKSRRCTSPATVVSYSSLLRQINKEGIPLNSNSSNIDETNRAKSIFNKENSSKIMNEIMKKMNEYFKNDFENLAKFNQYMYKKHIESKRALRNEILMSLSKLTKFEQEILLDYCKQLYTKSSTNASNNNSTTILESQDDAKYPVQHRSAERNNRNATNDLKARILLKSPWEQIESGGNFRKSSGSMTEKYGQVEACSKKTSDTNLAKVVKNDLKKYVDEMRGSLKENLIAKMNAEHKKRMACLQNQTYGIHDLVDQVLVSTNKVEKKQNFDENKTSDYSTGSDTGTSKYSDIKSKFVKSNLKNVSESSKSDPFANTIQFVNKIEFNNEPKKISSTNSLNKPVDETKKSPTTDSQTENKKSLKIDLSSSSVSTKTAQRKRDLSAARFLNSQNLINEKQTTSANISATTFIADSTLDETQVLKDSSIDDIVKNFAIENKRLSQIEMKFLNLRRNLDMYSDTGRVFI